MDMNNPSMLGKINMKNIMDGTEVKKAFDAMAEHPMESNTELLMQILRENKDT